MANLLDVAALAGVSRATVARAFSEPERLRAETRHRVLSAARSLGFRPNKVAQQLRTQATRMLGVMVPSLDNPVFAEQLQAMEEEARTSGYSLIVTTSGYDPDCEGAIVEEMLRQRVDGLALTVARADCSAILDKLRGELVPCLLVHNPSSSPQFPAIGVDNRAAMAEATRYLIGLGHCHIGMVGGPLLQSDRALLRYEGYRQVMQEAGLCPLPLIEMPRHTKAELARLLPALAGPTGLTGLLCTNDLLAISLIGELKRSGLTVPGDLSVMGFDGIELGRHLYPSLSTVVQPRAEIGRSAVKHLLRMIWGEAPSQHPLSHVLREGESTGNVSGHHASPFVHAIQRNTP